MNRLLMTVRRFPLQDRIYYEYTKDEIVLVNRSNSSFFYKDIIDKVMEQIVTHETLHHVIYHLEGLDACFALDKIQEWREILGKPPIVTFKKPKALYTS